MLICNAGECPRLPPLSLRHFHSRGIYLIMDEERTLWDGTPSQIINLPVFIICALVAGALIGAAYLFREQAGNAAYAIAGAAIVPLAIGFWKWIRTRTKRYHLNTERMQMMQGVFYRQCE